MADKKISQLTSLGTIAPEDLFVVVDDPAGSPETKKATGGTLLAFIEDNITVDGGTL